jgi:hypothetical protein
VYDDDPAWDIFSLLALKNNDQSPDRDVWHAFKYACTLNLPAGTIAPPAIGCSPMSLAATADLGHDAPGRALTVQNTGGGTLNYTVSADRAWMSVNPGEGSSTGEADTIAVTFPCASLACGTYTGTVTVGASGARNNPQTVAVTLDVYSTADFDADFDVDLGDFIFFQACFNGPNRPAGMVECSPADFNGDLDVDLGDFAAFQACFNGPNRVPSIGCSS